MRDSGPRNGRCGLGSAVGRSESNPLVEPGGLRLDSTSRLGLNGRTVVEPVPDEPVGLCQGRGADRAPAPLPPAAPAAADKAKAQTAKKAVVKGVQGKQTRKIRRSVHFFR